MDVYAQAISEFCKNIDHLVFLLDETFTIIYINPAVETFFDIKTKNTVKQPFLKEIKLLLKHSLFTETVFQIGNLPNHFKSLAYNHTDNPFYIHWHISLISQKPSSTLYTVLGNITFADKDNLANNLVNLANLMPGDLYWKNQEGAYLGCSQALLDKLNFTSVSDVIGKTDADLWPETAKSIRENDLAVMESKKIAITEETIQIPHQPAMTFISVKAPLLNKNNGLIGVIGNSLEITAQKKELEERNNQLKNQFIHNTQHDIRTPLSGIYGCSEILMLDEKDPRKKELLRHIQEATQCVLDYCEDIITFSKMDSGTVPLHIRAIDYIALLNKVITLEKPALKMQNLDFSLQYDIDANEIITSDSFRLERILINLISNAIKFTPQGSITVHTWTVKDTGIGIPKNQQDIIFDIFVRLTESDSSLFKGQGLGLSLVKKFVNDLSGEIKVDSEEGKGSTFILQLPMDETIQQENKSTSLNNHSMAPMLCNN